MKTKIRIATWWDGKNRFREVDGEVFPTIVEGLGIHRGVEEVKYWKVTHLKSGWAVVSFKTKAEAKRFLTEVKGEGVDWTVVRSKLMRAHTRRAVFRAKDKVYVWKRKPSSPMLDNLMDKGHLEKI